MTEAGDERRRQVPRVGCVLEVEYRNAGQFLVSYCTNLSRGGLFVSSRTPLPVGSELTLRLEIPGLRKPTGLRARVRWVRKDDGPEGPAGMGLSFEDIDGVLGNQIDRVVSQFSPLRIDIVGDPRQAWQHIAALVRSLVTCETWHHNLESSVAEKIRGGDLVIVDVDAAPEVAIDLLRALAEGSPRPPTLALCAARAVGLRGQAGQFATVVPTPVDSNELQASVLQTLSRVRARSIESSA